MPQFAMTPLSRQAIVTKAGARVGEGGVYLRLTDGGAPSWTQDPREATAFETMREATRASLRLPGELRAFALPRDVGCDAGLQLC